MHRHCKYIILLILFIITSHCLPAQQVHKAQAMDFARNYFDSKFQDLQKLSKSPTIVESCELTKDGDLPLYYVINYEGGGFLVLSADQRFYPVLAFSPVGSFDQTHLPDNCGSWIDYYEKQILTALENDGPFYLGMDKVWADLSKLSVDTGNVVVCPLLTSMWAQDGYYNQMCPEDEEGYNGHSPVGCVALAMAQLMYYYRFPESGSGSVSYTPSYHFGVYGLQSVDYSQAFYLWDQMTDICRADNDATAQLCYHTGVSLETAYMPEGSGANVNKVSAALSGHFNYLCDSYLPRSEIEDAFSWTQLLEANLAVNHPIIYRSSAGFGGHVYICDGFQDSTHLHFNWGWGGAYNGYYYINDLTPGGIQINFSQGAILNIYPDTTQFEYPNENADVQILSNNVGSFENGSGPLNYLPEKELTWLIQSDDPEITHIALDFSRIDTEVNRDEIRVFDGDSPQAPLLAVFSGKDIPPLINSSGPSMFVSFTSDEQNQYRGFHANYHGYHLPFCEAYNVLTDPCGEIEDGSRHHNYIHNADCNWVLAPFLSPLDSISQVTMHFYRFALASGDTLFVYDGESGEDPLLGCFSMGNNPVDLISSGNRVLLNFKTDDENTASGWTVGWDYVLPDYCMDTLRFHDPEALISDGSGDKNYVENSECYFLIDIPETENISIEFIEMDLEAQYDYLKFYDPDFPNVELEKISGQLLPEVLTFALSSLLVEFKSDYRDNFGGWCFRYLADASAIAEEGPNITIFPNPVADKLKVEMDNCYSFPLAFEIFTTDSRVVMTGFVSPENPYIYLRNLPRGVYIIVFDLGNDSLIRKIIKT